MTMNNELEKTKAKEVREIEFVYGLIVGVIIAIIGSLISFRKGVEHKTRGGSRDRKCRERKPTFDK